MSDVQVLGAGIVAAVVMLLTMLGWVLRKMWPVLVKAVHLVEDLAGEPARNGEEAVPGIVERVRRVEIRCKSIEHTVQGNGLVRAVETMGRQMSANTVELARLSKRVEES